MSLNRRHWLASLGGLILAGCDKLSGSPGVNKTVYKAEGLNLKAQRQSLPDLIGSLANCIPQIGL